MLGPLLSVQRVEHMQGCTYRLWLECGHDMVRQCVEARIPKRMHCKACGYAAEWPPRKDRGDARM